MADGSSNLEIIISAVDEASAALDEVNASLEGMSEAATAAAAETDSSLESVGLTMNEVTGEIENALLTQQQAFEQAAEIATQSDQDIIDIMLEEGVNAEEAAAIIAEANDEIGASSEEAATLSKSSFTTIGVAAGLAFAAVSSSVSDAVSTAQAWDEESAIIAQTLKDTGSSIPVSQVQAYAEQIRATTLLTQQQALQAEGLILSNKDLQGSYQSLTLLAADLATKMSQTSGTLSDNLPNATKLLTNALADPVAGMNQLIRQGTIEFPAATVTMIENMAKVGDTAGADAAIIRALNDQVGGMAQTAAQAPGAGLTQLSNSLTALGTQVGNDLLPDLDALAKAIIPIITGITNWAEEHPKLTEALVAGIVVFTALLAVLAIVGIVVAAVGSTFAVAAVSIAAVVALIAATVIGNWNLIAQNTETIWNVIKAFFTPTFEWLRNLFSTTLTDVKGLWDAAWTGMSDSLQNIWQVIENTVKTGFNDIIGAINGFIQALDAIHISIPAIQIPGTKIGTPALDLGFSIPQIPFLAEGGIVYNPVLAMIGEQGPEAVIPLSSLNGGVGGQAIQIFIQGGYYLDQNAATQIGNALAKQIVSQLRVRNYAT